MITILHKLSLPIFFSKRHWCLKCFPWKIVCNGDRILPMRNIEEERHTCLFDWVFYVPLRTFHSYGVVRITGEGQQIFYLCSPRMAIEQWGFFSVPELLWHPFIMVISEAPWHSQLLPSVWHWSCHYLFLRIRSTGAGIRTPNLIHKYECFFTK